MPFPWAFLLTVSSRKMMRRIDRSGRVIRDGTRFPRNCVPRSRMGRKYGASASNNRRNVTPCGRRAKSERDAAHRGPVPRCLAFTGPAGRRNSERLKAAPGAVGVAAGGQRGGAGCRHGGGPAIPGRGLTTGKFSRFAAPDEPAQLVVRFGGTRLSESGL